MIINIILFILSLIVIISAGIIISLYSNYKFIIKEYKNTFKVNIGDIVNSNIALEESANKKFNVSFMGKVQMIDESGSIKIEVSDYTTDMSEYMDKKYEKSILIHCSGWISKSKYKKVFKSDPSTKKLKSILSRF